MAHAAHAGGDRARRHAYQVTDEEIAALRGRYSDDELFEIIAATIVGDATRRVDKVLSLLPRRDRAV